MTTFEQARINHLTDGRNMTPDQRLAWLDEAWQFARETARARLAAGKPVLWGDRLLRPEQPARPGIGASD